jgi:hypothetical protein
VSSVVEPVCLHADTPTVAPKPTAQELAEEAGFPTYEAETDRSHTSQFSQSSGFLGYTLAKVRSLLPGAWNEKLSDWGLTGAIAGIVVLLLLTTVALLPKRQRR